MLTDYSTLPPCATEDAAGPCYWDAAASGNGVGQSFAVLPDGGVIPVGEYVTGPDSPGESPAPVCEAPTLPAEDGSCVDPGYWDESTPAPVTDSPGESAPIEGTTDTVYIPETGEIVHETTGEVIETVAVPVADDTPELAVTGPDDVSPLTVIVGALLMVVGVTLARRARRA